MQTKEEFDAKVQSFIEKARAQGKPEWAISKFVSDRRKEFLDQSQQREVLDVGENKVLINPQSGETIKDFAPDDFSDLEDLSDNFSDLENLSNTSSVSTPSAGAVNNEDKYYEQLINSIGEQIGEANQQRQSSQISPMVNFGTQQSIDPNIFTPTTEERILRKGLIPIGVQGIKNVAGVGLDTLKQMLELRKRSGSDLAQVLFGSK